VVLSKELVLFSKSNLSTITKIGSKKMKHKQKFDLWPESVYSSIVLMEYYKVYSCVGRKQSAPKWTLMTIPIPSGVIVKGGSLICSKEDGKGLL
jgi:hypothetical protein